jgi:ketosteroid isomerase-like protein
MSRASRPHRSAHRSPIKGVAQATGKTLDAQVTHIWDLADGKLVKFQQYTDTWQFAEVTGETPVT